MANVVKTKKPFHSAFHLHVHFSSSQHNAFLSHSPIPLSLPLVLSLWLSLSFCHLRGKVGDRTAVSAHRRPWSVEIAQPEIGELYLLQTSRARQQNVVQLHVTMADVLVVRVPHPADNLKE